MLTPIDPEKLSPQKLISTLFTVKAFVAASLTFGRYFGGGLASPLMRIESLGEGAPSDQLLGSPHAEEKVPSQMFVVARAENNERPAIINGSAIARRRKPGRTPLQSRKRTAVWSALGGPWIMPLLIPINNAEFKAKMDRKS